MLETVIIFKPKAEWRKKETWYSSWAPDWAKALLRHVTPDHLSQEELIAQMNEALSIPGLANAWTMPIKGRFEMLSTGLRTRWDSRSPGLIWIPLRRSAHGSNRSSPR